MTKVTPERMKGGCWSWLREKAEPATYPRLPVQAPQAEMHMADKEGAVRVRACSPQAEMSNSDGDELRSPVLPSQHTHLAGFLGGTHGNLRLLNSSIPLLFRCLYYFAIAL